MRRRAVPARLEDDDDEDDDDDDGAALSSDEEMGDVRWARMDMRRDTDGEGKAVRCSAHARPHACIYAYSGLLGSYVANDTDQLRRQPRPGDSGTVHARTCVHEANEANEAVGWAG